MKEKEKWYGSTNQETSKRKNKKWGYKVLHMRSLQSGGETKIYLTKAHSKWPPMRNTKAIPLKVKTSCTNIYIYIYILIVN